MGDGEYEYDDLGCTCWQGFPPCSFCTSMDEEEADVFAKGGAEAVRNKRRGIRTAAEIQADHYACIEEFGAF